MADLSKGNGEGAGKGVRVFRDRLAAEQRRLLLQAAEIGVLPAAGILERIAHLEAAIVATEAMIEQVEDQRT